MKEEFNIRVDLIKRLRASYIQDEPQSSMLDNLPTEELFYMYLEELVDDYFSKSYDLGFKDGYNEGMLFGGKNERT